MLPANYCPNPFEYETDNITSTKSSKTTTAYPNEVRWKCKDRRYLIRVRGSSNAAASTISSKCQWNKQYANVPDDLECVLTYCDNPSSAPNSDGSNHDFVWDRQVVPLTENVRYPCISGMRIENATSYKRDASSYSKVKCGSDGEFRYPTTWPQCSDSVDCPDPGNSEGVNRTFIHNAVHVYNATLKYVCSDPRQYIKVDGSSSAIAPYLTNRCQWKKSYPVDGTNLVCEIHHCGHPHNHPGKHDPPPTDHDLVLVTPNGWSDDSDWHVAFNDKITYKCTGNRFIEISDPIEIDPTKNQIEVTCKNTLGVYLTPVALGGSWPNCTLTVNCGSPPGKPTGGFVNAEPGFDGSATWLNGASTGQETYNTSIEYACAEGSQFDTNGTKEGNKWTLRTRCQWDKSWSPYNATLQLPQCVITHCTKPFSIPSDTFLEELTSDWTYVKETKKYQCKDQMTVGDQTFHTRFWESDRTRSTFEILCKEDGSFDFDNQRSSWPTCIKGINMSYIELITRV